MILVTVLVWLIVFGVLAWLVQSVIPMPPPFRQAALVVLALILVLLLLGAIGVLPLGFPRIAA